MPPLFTASWVIRQRGNSRIAPECETLRRRRWGLSRRSRWRENALGAANTAPRVSPRREEMG